MELIGEVVRVQIQPTRIKVAERYDPSGVMAVEELSLTKEGASAGGILDVHHADHHRGGSWWPHRVLLVGFTSHYERMRKRFGTIADGSAAENVLIASDRMWTEDDFSDGLTIGQVELGNVSVATPCVPFTRFLLGRPEATPHQVAGDLAMLTRGVRGFVCSPVEVGPFTIRVGDIAYAST